MDGEIKKKDRSSAHARDGKEPASLTSFYSVAAPVKSLLFRASSAWQNAAHIPQFLLVKHNEGALSCLRKRKSAVCGHGFSCRHRFPSAKTLPPFLPFHFSLQIKLHFFEKAQVGGGGGWVTTFRKKVPTH